MPRKSQKDKGQAIFDSWNHPLSQAAMWGLPGMYPWQIDFLNEASEPRAHVVGVLPNESGKTSTLIPALGLAVMAAFPGATVSSTAGVEEQIEGQLFKYLENLIRPFQSNGWKCSASALIIGGPSIRGLRSRWVARAPKSALTLEGYHGKWAKDDMGRWRWCPVCLIIDEAKTATEEIFEAIWRIDPDFCLVVSTGGPDFGPFFDSVDPDSIGPDRITHDHSALWTYRRQVSWMECPHLYGDPERKRIKEQLIEKYGERHPFIRSTLFGEFARASDVTNAFTDADLERVKIAMRRPLPGNPGIRRAALEVSGGGDEQVLMICDGDAVVFNQAFREKDELAFMDKALPILRQHSVEPRNCKVDGGGSGHAAIAYMEKKGYRTVSVYMNNQAPVFRTEYSDRITEDLFKLKELLRTQQIKLPNDNEMLSQMRQRRTCQDDHNLVRLEPKKAIRSRGQPSPDRLDTVIMLFSEWIPPRPGVKSDPERDYRSTLEEKARGGSGKGGRTFGWIQKQESMAEIMRRNAR